MTGINLYGDKVIRKRSQHLRRHPNSLPAAHLPFLPIGREPGQQLQPSRRSQQHDGGAAIEEHPLLLAPEEWPGGVVVLNLAHQRGPDLDLRQGAEVVGVQQGILPAVPDIDRQTLQGKGLSCWLATDKSNILSRITPEVYPAMASIHTKLPPVGDIHQAARERVYKIVLFLSPEEMKEAMRHVPSGRCTQWFSRGFDIIAGSGGKAVAVQKVLSNLGLTTAEAMAFGDGDNDMEMLRLVGTGVAMGNAPDKVKAAADYVTGHVDEDGLAEALRHFGLIR